MKAHAQPARPKVIPDAEIADLARTAHAAWESGLPMSATDSQGGLWSFVTQRDATTRLEAERASGPEDKRVTAKTMWTGAEMGRDEVEVLLASRILAVAAT